MFTEAYVKSFQVKDSGEVLSLRLSPASGYSFSSKTGKDEKSYLLFVEKNCVGGECNISANVRLVREDVEFVPSTKSLKKRITEAFLLILKTQHMKCRFVIDETDETKLKVIEVV